MLREYLPLSPSLSHTYTHNANKREKVGERKGWREKKGHKLVFERE